jgi:hypothetical protein
MASVSRAGWFPDQRRTIYLCALVLAAGVFFMSVYGQIIWGLYQSRSSGHLPQYTDYFALWSYAEVIFSHPVADLYNDDLLRSYQIPLGMNADQRYPFPYPPVFILMVWPLHLMPYHLGYLVTMLSTLAVFLWTLRQTCTRSPFLLAACFVAPVTIAGVWAGQLGFVVGALIVGGIRLAGTRPILAGILIGILTFKPQFGILIPVALVAAGLWTTILSACVTVAVLAAVTTAAFGFGIWADWLRMLPAYNAFWENIPSVLNMRPTVTASLQMLGVSLPAAKAVQAAVSVAAAVFVWRAFRQGPTRLAAAALLCGTLLATPHAYFYDLPMLLGAMVLFAEDRVSRGLPFSTAEIGILLLAFFFPVVLLIKHQSIPGPCLVLMLLFWIVVRKQPVSG